MVVHHCVRQTDHPNLTGMLSALAGYDTPAGSLATSSRPRPTTAIAIGARNSLRFGTAETRSSSQCEPMHRWSLLSVNAPRRHPVCIRQIAAVLTGQVRYSGGGADAARLQPARWPLLVSAPAHHLPNRAS